jgi:inorganic pyrophosphatase
MSYGTRSVDKPGSLQYRLFFTHNNKIISPFHDIPVWVDQNVGVANMVVEIPKGETAKMEISTGQSMNPIKQDVKKGKLRHVNWPYPCNYGAFPQTWENPLLVDQHTNAKGDNDPVDVCEIGGATRKSGDVLQVKILGTYAMIDEGETDWKVIAIDVKDPNANSLNDIGDVEKVFPGRLVEIFSFLKFYKTPTGAPPNVFAFNEQVRDKAFAMHVTHDCNEQWRKLVTKEIPNKTERYNISCFSTVHDSPFKVNTEESERALVESFLSYVRGV